MKKPLMKLLSDKEIKEIQANTDNLSNKELVSHYGVSLRTISRAKAIKFPDEVTDSRVVEHEIESKPFTVTTTDENRVSSTTVYIGKERVGTGTVSIDFEAIPEAVVAGGHDASPDTDYEMMRDSMLSDESIYSEAPVFTSESLKECIDDAMNNPEEEDTEFQHDYPFEYQDKSEFDDFYIERMDDSVSQEIIDLDEEVEEVANYVVIATKKSISISRTDSQDTNTRVIDSESELFDEALGNLLNTGATQETLELIYDQIYIPAMIENYSKGKIKIDAETDQLTYLGFNVDSKLTARILDMYRSEGATENFLKLTKFLDNLMENQSSNSVEQLYDFMMYNDIEIDDEGMIIAWRVITKDYKDKRTGKMDNSIGATVEMPRHLVNDNKHVACSDGLHVCAKAYIKSFSSSGDRLVKVSINPRDVVSVPTDYHGAKMRCCKFYVIKEVSSAYD